LLVVEPRPRNPLLADAIKRIGLAERTGRGIDLIYQGLLRYGRPGPDYSRSDSHSVVVVLPGGAADLGILQIVIEEEQPFTGVVAVALPRSSRASTDTTGRPLVFQATVPGSYPLRAA